MKRDAIAAQITISDQSFDGSHCWRWLGRHRKEDERPMIGREVYAYRAVYRLLRGAIPRGSVVHHRCKHAWCVNPWHIKLMRQGAHLKEHGLPGDWGQRFKERCPAGHPYNDTNTYRWRGERHCRACNIEAKARYRTRSRGKR